MTTRRLLDRIVRQVELPSGREERMKALLDNEWIVTNGLGGYASSSMAGITTRRYHGILVAALPNPLGRVVVLNHLDERIKGEMGDRDTLTLRLEAGLPVWECQWGKVRIERRIVMPHRQNTVFLTYRVMEGPDVVTLELQPAIHFRGYEEPVNATRNSPVGECYHVTATRDTQLITSDEKDLPPLRMQILDSPNSRFVNDPQIRSELVYPVEHDRGYEFKGALWTPGWFEVDIKRGECATFVASVEDEDVMRALTPGDAAAYEYERRRRLIDASLPQCQDEVGAELVLAADQFIITPKGRLVDATRAAAMGNEIRTVIAGYHWFTDWGRDTMISLEGLTLMTGRQREAAFILRTFAHYVRDGLIPNMFPDGSNEGLYHTADASLWFFHAAEAYIRRTGDQTSLMHILPVMLDIVDHHIKGTRFGIRMDPHDELLTQGAEGYQLTWMDAKVDGWVVTPRRGKPVEINALWYNALRLLQGWLVEVRGEGAGDEIAARADRVYECFNKCFWNPAKGYLYDVIDGDSAEKELCRPNQIFSISLDHPVLDKSRWEPVMKVVQERLLTPVGLRSLAPGEPGYKERYFGDLRARDAAYHQGTVWGWLIGPWIDAWLKLHPDDRAGARKYLDGCIAALATFGVGSIGEVFDAQPPYTPRGCIAQAWSVAEVLRCWVKTTPDVKPVTVTA